MNDAYIWVFYQDTYPYPLVALRDALGSIPYMLDRHDPRSAIEQFDEKYLGGWDRLDGFSLIDGIALKYPEDPLMHPYARLAFHGDTVLVYPHSWVCVVRPDRTFEVARLN